MKATTLKKAALVAGSLSFLAGSAFSQQSAVSGAGGYETLTLRAGQFNVMGLRLHGAQVVSGTFDASTDTSLTDNDVNFDDVLTADTTYLVELTGATTSEGTVIEVATWSGNDLTGLGGIVAEDVTDYTIRPAKTIDDVFGADNSAGLAASSDGGTAGASIVFVPNGTGGFDRYFYVDIPNQFQGWLNVATGEAAGSTPLNYIDGIIVQEKGADDLSLIVTGMVKTSSTKLPVDQLFTYLGSVYPVGSTLGNSGLGGEVSSSADGGTAGADIVYLPTDDATGFGRYFHVDIANQFTGWVNIATGEGADDTALTSGMIIDQNGTGAAFNADIVAPDFYANL